MDLRPTVFKRVSGNDTVFFVFEITHSKYILYDSGLGDPIKYGSQKLILGELENQQKQVQKDSRSKYKVYWLVRDPVKGWKETPQPPAGYSRDGVVDKFPKADGNTPNIQMPKLKKIYPKEEQFYWFELVSGKYVIYDSDMGSPISYGSSGFIYKTFENIDSFVRKGEQDKYILWYFTRNGSMDSWEHKQTPRIPNWKVESTDKKKLTDEKKEN